MTTRSRPEPGRSAHGGTDLGIHCDDCYRPVTFPFPIRVYNTTYTAAHVSSNGIVNFSGPNLQYANGCLPARVEGRAIILLWDDMDTRPSGRGVFTSTVGSAPNRQFIIRFNMAYLSGGGSANVEVIFTEGSDNFQVIYGTATQGGSSSTEGVQAAGDRPELHRVRLQRGRPDAGSAPELHLFGAGGRHHRPATASATTAATTASAATASTATTTSAAATTSTATAAASAASSGALQGAAGDRAEARRRRKTRIRRARCSVGRIRRARSRRVGRVIAQSPRPGVVKRRGFPVRLVVGRR